MFRFAKAAQSNSTQSTTSNADSFQILARRPMQTTAKVSPARVADPTRETLPWPLPEAMQEQLASFGSIRETEPWVR